MWEQVHELLSTQSLIVAGNRISSALVSNRADITYTMLHSLLPQRIIAPKDNLLTATNHLLPTDICLFRPWSRLLRVLSSTVFQSSAYSCRRIESRLSTLSKLARTQSYPEGPYSICTRVNMLHSDGLNRFVQSQREQRCTWWLSQRVEYENPLSAEDIRSISRIHISPRLGTLRSIMKLHLHERYHML